MTQATITARHPAAAAGGTRHTIRSPGTDRSSELGAKGAAGFPAPGSLTTAGVLEAMSGLSITDTWSQRSSRALAGIISDLIEADGRCGLPVPSADDPVALLLRYSAVLAGRCVTRPVALGSSRASRVLELLTELPRGATDGGAADRGAGTRGAGRTDLAAGGAGT
ncbi:MAG: hypothetical protein M9942_11160 [Microthrixaceae bacterium]|nr:hypothetical protein [Microthrixaceae bacterium]